MSPRTFKTTFVGPVTRTPHPHAGKPKAPLYKGASFNVLQGGGSLKLEYAKYIECVSARRMISGNPNTHQVPTDQLLQAIHQALMEAQESEQTPSPSEGTEEVSMEVSQSHEDETGA